MKIFGCKAISHVPRKKRGKLDDRARFGIFVGMEGYDRGTTRTEFIIQRRRLWRSSEMCDSMRLFSQEKKEGRVQMVDAKTLMMTTLICQV
jgi:hypothetical protein